MPPSRSSEYLGIWSSKHAPTLLRTSDVRAVHGTNSEPHRLNGTECPLTATTSTTATSQVEFQASHELARFQHAVRRLRWKLPYLADAHRKATMYRVKAEEATDVLCEEEERKEVETMFKLDFYEYYNVLERCLVHLLRVWGIEVEGVERGAMTHTYHASLLNTLTHPTNPLRPVLGQGPVYEHLQSAKQLRNRWKNAEVAGESNSPPPLDAWAIEEMISAVFNAFEVCEGMARKEVEKVLEVRREKDGERDRERQGGSGGGIGGRSWADEMEREEEDDAVGNVIESDEMDWE